MMLTAGRRRRTQADRSSEMQSTLIAAAIRTLHELGYAGTTTSLIARCAGVTTGALHHHFLTKEDLMIGVLDHAAALVGSRLREIGEGVASSGGARDFIRHVWQIYSDPEYWAAWEIIIGARRDPLFHSRVVQHRLSTMRTQLYPWVESRLPLGDEADEAVALIELILISIRGLRLERFLHEGEDYFSAKLDLLAEVFGSRLDLLVGRGMIGAAHAPIT
jgi:AcrR family transcriptional regulator